MKKLQILLLLLTMVGGLSGHLKCQASTSSKIIFEDDLNIRDLSNEEGQKEGYTSNMVCVQLHLDYETKTERLDVDKDASLKEIKEAKASRLARMKDYYYNKNKDISSNIEINGNESMYISKYTPYIEYEFTYEAYKTLEHEIIDEINDCQYIDTAYVGYSEKKIKDDMRYTLGCSNGLRIYTDGLFTGEGVTVGILETGIMDVDHPNFANTDCEYFDNFWRIENVTDHAIYTSNLIGGSKGILPNARILSAEINGTYTNEIEWFLENGADIINMSFGEDGNYGYRTSRTKYLDYIITNYDVAIVAAAGNNDGGNYKVSNPGCGYNIITVGAANGDLMHLSYSSYLIDNDIISKPNIITVGESLTIAEQYYGLSGTSMSCAAVTGMIGMLFEAYPYCSTSAALTSLLVCTTADMVDDCSRWTDAGFDVRIGSGLLNIYNAIMLAGYEEEMRVRNVQAGDILYEATLVIPANYNFRMGVGRYCGDPSSQNSDTMMDLSLCMYDRYNTRIAHAYGAKEPILVVEREYDYEKTVRVQIVANSDQVLSYEDIFFVTNLGLA